MDEVWIKYHGEDYKIDLKKKEGVIYGFEVLREAFNDLVVNNDNTKISAFQLLNGASII
jgi:hypothetical protein